ncbi:MAG: hypothetical protein ABH825_04245, partial [Candidatus Omnitrophota bacterium]
RKRRYGDAMLMFQKVDAMAPDYSGTNYYMNRIRKIVEKKGAAPEPEPLKKKKIRIRKEDLPEQIPPELPPTPEEKQKEEEKKILEQARALYEEAMLLYKCRNYSEAFGKFEEVRKIKPGYARTEYLIKRILDDIGEKQREEEKRRLRGAIDQLYEEARLSYKSGYFKEAEDIFRHILLLDPDEREAKAYVSRKIPEQMKKVSDREMRGVQERLEKARRKQLEWNRKKAIENKNEAAAAYKQALSLYKKKLYREAFGKFNEAQNMIPNYSRSEYYIKHIMAIIEKQQRREEAKMLDGAIGSLFKEGMMFYDNQHYDKALEIFEHILTLDPSHRGAKRYAEKQIPARIEEIKDKDKRHAEKYLKKERLERAKLERLNKLYTKKEAERLYDQAIACFKKKQYGAAMEKFESVQNLIPDYARSQDYLKRARLAIEQKWQREKEENEKKALEEKKMRADRMYREAILLYKDKKYKEAFEGFSDTQDMVPGYLDTDGYIEKIFRIIEKEGKKVTIRTKKEEKKEEKARALYDRARKLYKQRKYQEAMDKFNEANTVMPGYSHTDYYLQLIQGDMQREKELAEVKARQEENRQKIRQASMLYKQALSLYTRKKYEESLGKFKEVLDTIDGYGATYYYMQRIPRDIEKETRQKEEQSLTAVPAVDFTKSGFSLSVGK